MLEAVVPIGPRRRQFAYRFMRDHPTSVQPQVRRGRDDRKQCPNSPPGQVADQFSCPRARLRGAPLKVFDLNQRPKCFDLDQRPKCDASIMSAASFSMV